MAADQLRASAPTLHTVVPGIVEVPADAGQPHLLGARCPVCRTYFFPAPPRCRKCLGAVERCSIGSEGAIYSYTVIRTRPPLGLPQPYGLGYVDIEPSGLRIFCLLDPAAVDELRIGMRVRLEVSQLGHDGSGSPCLRPYFTPKGEPACAELRAPTKGTSG